MSSHSSHRTVPVMTRVEGEGALELSIKNERIETLRLRIFEPPRFFEEFLQGRYYTEIADLVARICGICPVAYQMSAVQAIEQAFTVTPARWVHELRRLIYCGEWIQSHALHIHFLAAPDFLGFGSALEMAEKYPAEVRRGLRLQALGNEIIHLLGARSVHPVGICPGGFYRMPTQTQAEALQQKLRGAIEDAKALLYWTASLPLPEEEQQFTSVSLQQENEYPICEGRITSDRGLDIAIDAYQNHFIEHQEPHSTALYSLLDGEPYLVGPLARMNINHRQLGPVREIVDELGVIFPSHNMFHSIIARAAEILYALFEAIRLLECYVQPNETRIHIEPCAGSGYGASEAPRGLLWHSYKFNGSGQVVQACIIPPTAQNQARIEEDLLQSIEHIGPHQPEEMLRRQGEMVIRNYDPCISCATHFLKMSVDRR